MIWKLKRSVKQVVYTGACFIGISWSASIHAQIIDPIFNGSNDPSVPGSIIRIEYWNPADGTYQDPSGNDFSSNINWTNAEMSAIQRGMQYWWDVLGEGATPGRTVTMRMTRNDPGNPNFSNAYASSVYVNGSDPILTQVQNAWGMGQSTPPPPSSGGALIDVNLAFEFPTFVTEFTGIYSPPGAPIEAIMIHEVGHTLGFSGPAAGYFGATGYIADGVFRLSPYEEYIRDASGNAVVAGQTYTTGTPYFFAGPNALAVYGAPVPLNTRSNQLSHLGITPLLMTHESYRNYTFFTEVELAVLKDVAFSNLDLKQHFGQSYYQDGTTATNTNGFNSTKTYGVGLHMKGNGQNITQAADINAAGVAGNGIRVDGMDNTVTIGPGVNVHADGDYGVGLLVSYGTDNVIVHRGNLTADSTTADAVGTGMMFSFGSNILGPLGAPDLTSDTPTNSSMYAGFRTGYLVDRVDISGSVSAGSGTGNVIYIDNTAGVREINILAGAVLNGNIYTDPVINTSVGIQRPTITFGHAQTSGVKQNSADLNFNFNYNGNITAGNSSPLGGAMDAVFVGGRDAANGARLNGNVTFNNVSVLETGKFTVGGTTVAQNITNDGRISGVSGSTLSAQQGFYNNGTLTGTGMTLLSAGEFENAGTMNLTNSTLTSTADVWLNTGLYTQQNGALNVDAIDNLGGIVLENVTTTSIGDVTSSGEFSQFGGTTDVGGSLVNSGNFFVNNGSMTIADTLHNTGLFQASVGSVIDTTGVITNGTTGSLELFGGSELNGSAGMVSAGSLVLNEGHVHLSDGSFLNQGATTSTDGHILIMNGDMTIANKGSYTGTRDIIEIDAGALNVIGTMSSSQSLLATGDLNVSGSLQLSDSSIAVVAGTTNVAAAGKLTLNDSFVASNGPVSFNGQVRNNGGLFGVVSGNLNIGSTGSYRGVDDTLAVTNGGINVAGTLASQDGLIYSSNNIVVQQGGRLAGTALVDAPRVNVNSGGVLAAGNSIGTMVIDGDLHLNGAMEVEVAAAQGGQDADLVVVQNGQAFINDGTSYAGRGTFNFIGLTTPSDNTFDIARRYTIMTTDGDGDLQVDARPKTTDDIANRRMILRSDKDVSGLYTPGARDYYAYVGRDVDYSTLAVNDNQQVVAGFLNSIAGMDDGSPQGNNLQWLRDTIDLLPTEGEVRSAMDQLVGASTATIYPTLVQQIHLNTQRMASNLRNEMELYAYKFADIDEEDGFYGNISGFGTGGNIDGSRQASGYKYNSGGTQLQVGYRQRNAILGAYYNYTNGTIDGTGNVGVEMNDFGGFFIAKQESSHLLFSVGGGHADLNSRRTILIGNTAIQNPISAFQAYNTSTTQYNTNAELGFYLLSGPVTLRPFASFTYVYLESAEFNEGLTPLAMRGRIDDMESCRSQFGTDLNFNIPGLPQTWLNFRGAWMHEYASDGAGLVVTSIGGLPAGTFGIQGVDLGRDFAVFGASLSHYFIPGVLRGYGGYDLLAGTNSDLHTGSGGIEFIW